jgi:hypothetical protein
MQRRYACASISGACASTKRCGDACGDAAARTHADRCNQIGRRDVSAIPIRTDYENSKRSLFVKVFPFHGPPLWSGGQSSWLQVRVRFPALSDFLRSSGSGTGSTQPREYN